MGKPVASYQIRVNLHDNTAEGAPTRDLTPPTNAEMERIVGDALYGHTNFYQDEITVESERLDK